MSKQMLIDATHPEEIRVAVADGKRLEEFDVEIASRKPLKGNIYLAKVTRVEPSLQAAFVEYGGNRHGFLAFGEIHPDYYRIPVADREALKRETARAYEEDLGNEDAENTADMDAPALASSSDSSAETMAELIEALPEDQQDALLDQGILPSDALSMPAPEAEQADQETGPKAESDSGNAAHAALPDDPEADEEIAKKRRMRALRRYKIQEVIKRRQIMLVQVIKEERGNKGAALTTYLSLAGRYCVLMPNTDRGGGISRRITNVADRKRLKAIMDELELPTGMAVILRTAGSERSKVEVRRDYEYLIRLWNDIRELTLNSTAPSLIYEEANLIKRSIRDLYTRDIENIIVAGEDAHKAAKDFMKMLMPSHAKRVQIYRDQSVPLFQRYQIESQIAAIHDPVVQLKSGGYIVINQTEALVAIDVNSGKATRERNIEETASRTNLEAADEIARQLRLRDLAGLIVIDFIDMEENRHNSAVEKRLKEALRNDRARIQLGRISMFGLLEMSRQRLNPSLAESSTELCPHCNGTGRIRSVDSTALHILRMIEEELTRQPAIGANIYVPHAVALYILNQKRRALAAIEHRLGARLYLFADDSLVPPSYRLERLKELAPGEAVEKAAPLPQRGTRSKAEEKEPEALDNLDNNDIPERESFTDDMAEEQPEIVAEGDGDQGDQKRRRRRGRRGGRRRGRRRDDQRMSDNESGEFQEHASSNANEPFTERAHNGNSSFIEPRQETNGTSAFARAEIETAGMEPAESDNPKKRGWWRRLVE